MALLSWKYRAGLFLILVVVLIWVTSAEVTQMIFTKYRHPFLLTWLGASMLSVYLPISWLKNSLISIANSYVPKLTKAVEAQEATVHPSPIASPVLASVSPRSATSKDVEMLRMSNGGLHSDDTPESESLLAADHAHADQPKASELSASELLRIAAHLAPMWLLTEYLSNASLSMTSVASTTILSSTSGLFTLLFGVSLGHDTLSTAKVLSVVVSIVGVIMTEMGKSTSADEKILNSQAGDNLPGSSAGDNSIPSHSLIGDMLGLASAASYGLYTILLRKYAGGEDSGADMQKLFGYIGLVTLLGLWWIAFPLILLGLEPIMRLPSSYGLDEDIVGNALIGSVASDYFWALTVVWTTPLVATLGLSLTIPLAMVADMVMHGETYSIVYILGSAQVFGGFLVANLADRINWHQKQ